MQFIIYVELGFGFFCVCGNILNNKQQRRLFMWHTCFLYFVFLLFRSFYIIYNSNTTWLEATKPQRYRYRLSIRYKIQKKIKQMEDTQLYVTFYCFMFGLPRQFGTLNIYRSKIGMQHHRIRVFCAGKCCFA